MAKRKNTAAYYKELADAHDLEVQKYRRAIPIAARDPKIQPSALRQARRVLKDTEREAKHLRAQERKARRRFW
jgi:hypothetical protein